MTRSWSPQMICAGLVHRADAVGVAVEGDAQLGAGPPDRLLQVLEVLGNGRIGVVVREGAVRLAEERRHLGAERLEGRDGDHAADAVPAVGDHLDRPLELVAADDRLAVALQHRVVGGLLPRPAAPPLGGDDLPEAEDVLAVEGLAREDHLEAVELGRIVGPGDLDARRRSRARTRRSRGRASAACRRPPRCRRRRRCRGARPGRAPGRTAGCRVRPRSPARGPIRSQATVVKARPSARANSGVSSRVHEAADVVLPEDGLGDVHGPPSHEQPSALPSLSAPAAAPSG